jgi:hypothetical protein
MNIKTLWEQWKSGALIDNGVSSTKLVYMFAGGMGVIAAFITTIAFCGHTMLHDKADLNFAGAVSALWIAVFGFATNAQNNKAKADTAQSNADQAASEATK